MAPPVRILTLLVLAVALATGRPLLLLVGTLAVLTGWVAAAISVPEFDVRGFGRMLRRVRWLLLAILLVYGGLTPGEPLVPALGAWSPSVDGARLGAIRVAALLAIVAAVHLLLATTSRGALVGGLLWFGGPARRLGLDDSRFAARLILALEAVPQVQDLARGALQRQTGHSRLERLAGAAGETLRATLQRAEELQGPIDVPERSPVPARQWLLPLFLVLLFAALALQG
ncbi:MAG: hypothetical protein LOY58_02335 [Gammaproteobacteria bacterium]|nr:hypothetical protein [Gammaproteobacteria bacterium]